MAESSVPAFDLSTEELGERIARASSAYYTGDSPLMTDDQFDALAEEYRSRGGSETVGSGFVPTTRKVRHRVRMLSLGKVHSLNDVRRWLAGLDPTVQVSVEPKWDGSAIALYYSEDGEYSSAATRGDGSIGEDVSRMARLVGGVPARVSPGTDVVLGEVLMSRISLEEVNSRFSAGYANTRNSAAGLIRRLDDAALEMAPLLSFQPHDYPYGNPYEILADSPVEVDMGRRRFSAIDADAVEAHILRITEWRSSCPFDIDGVVLKVLDPAVRGRMGDNGHHPRWAVAYKFEAETRLARVTGVTWNTGRTGRVVPVLEFEPTTLVGAVTTRATMHNLTQFRALDPHDGDVAYVKRAGDVIPYVVGVEAPSGIPRGERFAEPMECPGCGAELQAGEVDLVCVNADCNLLGRLLHSLAVFQIDGVASATIAAFVEHGLLTEDKLLPALIQLGRISEEDIAALPRFGFTSAQKVAYALHQILDPQFTYLHEWIALLGMKGIGTTIALAITGRYGSIADVVDAVEREAVEPGSLNVAQVGPSRAVTLVGGLPELRELMATLQRERLDPPPYRPSQREAVDSSWSGLNVVVTGTLEGVTRSQAHAWLVAHGATVQSSIVGNTDVLVAGEKAGSKLQRAQDRGIKIVGGTEFIAEIEGKDT